MSANISGRLTTEMAFARIGLAPIVGCLYTPTSDFDTLPLFGPCRNIEIDDPWVRKRLTGGGDAGEMEKHGRRDIWNVRIEAMLDACGVSGEARFGKSGTYANTTAGIGLNQLNGAYVEFCILNANGYYICKGMGKMSGRVTMNAGEGDPIMRDVTISRYLPHATGDIVWANLATGLFV